MRLTKAVGEERAADDTGSYRAAKAPPPQDTVANGAAALPVDLDGSGGLVP